MFNDGLSCCIRLLAVPLLLLICSSGKPVPRAPIPPADEKALLLIVYSLDCPYCNELNRMLETNQSFRSGLENKYRVRKVESHSEAGMSIRNTFHLRTVPTYVIVNPTSGVSTVIKGYSSPERLALILGIDYKVERQAPGLNVTCGDGVIEGGEECDDGNTNSGDGCSSSCEVEPGFVCTGQPSVCMFSCGNGTIEAGEECDDGNTNSGDGCSASCAVEPGFVCTGQPSVCMFSCGNGTIEAGEGCDDGNTNSGDGCSSSCQVEPGYVCTGVPSVCMISCGNGTIEAGEGCDDGNTVDGDGCSSACAVELGFECTGQPSICVFVGYCGDGVVQAGEECDDGNTINGDGCSSTCLFEGVVEGVSINEDGTRPAPGSILDVKSTDKGILVPRMTTAQRTAIASPPVGLLVFDMTTGSFWYHNGTIWKELATN